MAAKKSILIITNELPLANSGGAKIRNFHLAKELAKYYQVTLLTCVARRERRKSPGDLREFCEVVRANYRPEEVFRRDFWGWPLYFYQGLQALSAKLVRSAQSSREYSYQIFALRRSLRRLIKNRHFDFIQVEHSEFGAVLEGVSTSAIRILDFHNVNSSALAGTADESYFIDLEKKLAEHYDVALCCSAPEKERLAALGYQKILIVPNGVDLAYFKGEKFSAAKRSLLFLGSLRYQPNIEGLKYFIEQIFPLLGGDWKLEVVGAYDQADFQQEKKQIGITFHGYVEDIRPFLQSAILVCPLLQGGGTRLKILTALAAGTPVISTTKGAEGLSLQDNQNILLADRPGEFRDKIFQLLEDSVLAQKISVQGRELAEKFYGWEQIGREYAEKLQAFKRPRLAIFHNFLDNVGGAEIVALTLARELEADIYTTNFDPEKVRQMGFSPRRIFSIGRVPKNPPFKQEFCHWRFKCLNLGRRYDFYLLAGDWSVASAKQHQPNLWYAHSPIREIWDLYDYNKKFVVSWWQIPFFAVWVFWRRLVNRRDLKSVQQILCSSAGVQKRIAKYLKREARIVYPPVDTSRFYFGQSGDFWLSVNRLYDYKRVDLQLKAFRALPAEKLIVVGPSEKAPRFQSYAKYCHEIKPVNVEIISSIERADLINLYANCRGFIATSRDEDFGINVVEALAAGKPVVASNEGGYRETMVSGATGLLLDGIDEHKLAQAVQKISAEIESEPLKFKGACQAQAQKFDVTVFIQKINEAIGII